MRRRPRFVLAVLSIAVAAMCSRVLLDATGGDRGVDQGAIVRAAVTRAMVHAGGGIVPGVIGLSAVDPLVGTVWGRRSAPSLDGTAAGARASGVRVGFRPGRGQLGLATIPGILQRRDVQFVLVVAVALAIAGLVCVRFAAIRRRFERQAVETVASHSRRLLDRHYEGSPLAVIEWDDQNRVVRWSPRAAEVFGFSNDEAIGRTWDELGIIEPDDESVVREAVAAIRAGGAAMQRTANRNRHRDGRLIECVWYNSAIRGTDGEYEGILSYADDVTEARAEQREREAIEERLVELERSQIIGTLAAGVAHDINNSVTVLRTQCAIARAAHEAGTLHGAMFEELDTASSRVGDVARALMSLADGGSGRPEVCDLRDVLRDALSVAATILPASITLTPVDCDGGDEALVCADPGRLHQVFMNLIVNARDAMPDGGGIEVRLDRGQLAGSMHRVSVSDDGTGMTEAVRQRVFDPFFTTKPRDLGTGLGLSIVRRLLEAIGGSVEVESIPGVGTGVHLWLPAAPDTGDREKASALPRRRSRVAIVGPDSLGTAVMLHEFEAAGSTCQRYDDLAAFRKVADEPGTGEFDVVVVDERQGASGLAEGEAAALAAGRVIRLVGPEVEIPDALAEESGDASVETIGGPFRVQDLIARVTEAPTVSGAGG